MHHESNAAKFIVFKIADYLLALPIGDVLKVVKCSSVASRGLRTMGLVEIGRHTIRVLDLHLHLSVETRNFASLQIGDLPQGNANQPFLVITRDQEGELCGISVDEPPDLLELPHQMMRSLPKSDRHGKGVLEMVSHAAVVSQKDVTTTIFLLDLNRVLNTAINDFHPPALKPS